MNGDGHFLVLALPRSRTAWLAHFLGYGTFRVGHDIAVQCKRIDDFVMSFGPQMKGSVETGAVSAWRIILDRLPKIKLVVIRRQTQEVIESLARLGVPITDELVKEMNVRAALLDFVSTLKGVHTVQFPALNDEEVCNWLFEHCLGIPHDPLWWETLSRLNIQIDFQARLTQLARNREALDELKEEIALENARLVEADRCPVTLQ